MNRRITALALAGVFALGLTGCGAQNPGDEQGTDGGFGSGSSQTVKEACATFSSAMETSQEALTTAMEDAATDPAKAVEALGILQKDMTTAFDSITNSEVAALGKTTTESLATFSEIATDVIGNGNIARAAELGEASNAFTASLQELQTLCG